MNGLTGITHVCVVYVTFADLSAVLIVFWVYVRYSFLLLTKVAVVMYMYNVCV